MTRRLTTGVRRTLYVLKCLLLNRDERRSNAAKAARAPCEHPMKLAVMQLAVRVTFQLNEVIAEPRRRIAAILRAPGMASSEL